MATAADMREGLFALAVGAGLQVLTAMMDADLMRVARPKGKHNPDRVGTVMTAGR